MYIVKSIRQKLFPRKTLIAGPYVGEFGHELMDWQGYVRARKQFYKEVHVITYSGHEILYEDCVVHTHNIRLEDAGYFYGNMPSKDIDSLAKKFALENGICNDYDIFNTNYLSNKFLRKIFWNQKYRRLYENSNLEMKDLLFHFRKMNKTGPDKSRNYSTALAEELYHLCIEEGYSVRCIGHPDYSYCPEGCEDNRSEDLRKTVATICATRLTVGELSGPLHLAVFSAKPIIIWAPGKWRIDNCFRNNPFHVDINVVDDSTTNPSPISVLECINKKIKMSR